MLGNLFKGRSHYVFDYKPRYYDEKKERIVKLKKQYSKTDNSQTKRISIDKDNLRAQWTRNRRKVSNRNSNIRLAIILAVIIGLATYILEIHTFF